MPGVGTHGFCLLILLAHGVRRDRGEPDGARNFQSAYRASVYGARSSQRPISSHHPWLTMARRSSMREFQILQVFPYSALLLTLSVTGPGSTFWLDPTTARIKRQCRLVVCGRWHVCAGQAFIHPRATPGSRQCGDRSRQALRRKSLWQKMIGKSVRGLLSFLAGGPWWWIKTEKIFRLWPLWGFCGIWVST